LAQGEVTASKQKASRILAGSSAAISISECMRAPIVLGS
jgi:hypothetical protein